MDRSTSRESRGASRKTTDYRDIPLDVRLLGPVPGYVPFYRGRTPRSPSLFFAKIGRKNLPGNKNKGSNYETGETPA